MNLADIRKKAQKERGNRPEPLNPSPVEVADASPFSGFPDIPMEDFPDILAEQPDIPHDGGAEAAAPSAPSDPIALILAGRDGMEALSENLLEDEAAPFAEFLCFRVADEVYAVNILEMKEIIKPREMTEVPRTPHFVSGVFSLRGVIVPVIDMRRRLGLSCGEGGRNERVVVVKNGAGFSGLYVDEVIGVVSMDESSIEPPPAVLEGIDRDFVGGMGRFDGRMIILLNLGQILDIDIM